MNLDKRLQRDYNIGLIIGIFSSHVIFIACKCNNTLLLVYLNIACLHAQKLYNFKEHLRRVTVIYIYCENLQNYLRYRTI